MTGIDHEGTEQIDIAARWLAENWHVVPQPYTRVLRESFGLNFNDAVKAIAEAKRVTMAADA